MPRRTALVLPVLVLVAGALTACSSAAPSSGSSGTAVSSAAAAAAPASSDTSASAAAGGGAASGTITFSGATSGTMAISVCHGGLAQVTVEFADGSASTNGLIDADDFTFVGPDSSGYTLADGAPKPTISGKTYTVDTKLVGITTDATVQAKGSVTCP